MGPGLLLAVVGSPHWIHLTVAAGDGCGAATAAGLPGAVGCRPLLRGGPG